MPVDAEFGRVAAVERDDELAVDLLDREVGRDVVDLRRKLALTGLRVERANQVVGLLQLFLVDGELAHDRPEVLHRERLVGGREHLAGVGASGRVGRHHVELDEQALLQVARSDPMKDWPLFLEATRRLPNALRIAVGAGTENLPDEDGLIRLGRREDVAAILSCVDVLVSSSAFGEGQSNSIAEAMASCCPVVATDVGDARLMLTGGQVSDAGLVVPRRDVKALRKAIQDLCANEQQRHALGSAGRERIESQYQPNSMMIAFNRLFSS